MKRILFFLYGIPLVCIGVAMIMLAYLLGGHAMNYLGPAALVIILIGVRGFCKHAASKSNSRKL